ncbi:MAG: sigma-70 family RNA polymerase sigma factor [Thermoguttaceae bacterium]
MTAHDSKIERLAKRAGRGDRFATTHWSMVVRAGGSSRSPEAARALASLCESYWFPLYAFVRRTGRSADDAQDLTQEFFVRLLDQGLCAKADRERGKFRSFLLAAMKHFLADEWDRANAQRRGGGRSILSLDSLNAEARYRLEPATDLTPERMFEKQWALALLDRVLSRLQAEWTAAGKQPLFESLKDTLAGLRSIPYAAIGAKLGMSEGAVKVAAHRLRRRYRAILREEIAQTVDRPEDVADEIRYLLSCL